MNRNYCSFCRLVVPLKEPQHVKLGDKVYHHACFQKKKRRDWEDAQSEALELQLESNAMLPDLPPIKYYN